MTENNESRQIECARKSLAHFPCSACTDSLDVDGIHLGCKHPRDVGFETQPEARCTACRITMGERIALGTLLLAGPDMEAQVTAFIREHRITQ